MSKCDFDWPERTMNDEEFDSEGWPGIVSFNTINGESIGVQYNISCIGESNADFLSSNNVSSLICAQFLYDLNGASKGPNKFGKDMGFITAFFPEYPIVVAPMPMAMSVLAVEPDEAEEYLSANSEYRLPSPAEAVTLSLNKDFITTAYGGPDADGAWTDNNVSCNFRRCLKNPDSDERLYLVSKNGNAPKKLKLLDGVPDMNTQEGCEAMGFHWAGGQCHQSW